MNMKLNRIISAAFAAFMLVSCSAEKQMNIPADTGTAAEEAPAETAEPKTAENNAAEAPAAKTETAGELSEAEALQAALDHAGVKESEIVFTKKGTDIDHGWKTYEFDFHAGGTKYEYDIDAADGSVISFEKEIYRGPENNDGLISFEEAFRIGLQESGLKYKENERKRQHSWMPAFFL